MAFGDEFQLNQVKAFALAEFAHAGGIDRQLLIGECQRLHEGISAHAMALAQTAPDEGAERQFATRFESFALEQTAQPLEATRQAAKIRNDYLQGPVV